MKNLVKLLFVFILTSAIFSCKNYDDDIGMLNEFTPNDLFGRWSDTISSGAAGKTVHYLTFYPNSSFNSGTKYFGKNKGQTSADLSSYIDYSGNYVLSGNKILFVSEQNISWDSTSGVDPIKTLIKEEIFKSCTFELVLNYLNITYITNQANATVNTSRVYKRIDKYK